MANENRITELASIISNNTSKIGKYLEDNKLPSPSFHVDAPSNLGIARDATEIEQARRDALEATLELQDLLTPASALLRPNINATSLQFIYRNEIAAKVPLHGTATFEQLAEQCKVSEPDVRRLLRFAMVMHRLFCEPEEGKVAHTAASRLLVESQQELDMAGFTWEEDYPAFARTADAMQKWGDGGSNHTGHNLAFDYDGTFYDWLKNNPEKSRRFNSAISLFANDSPTLLHLKTSFAWADIPPNGTVVDVGGGTGSVARYLAEAFDHLNFVVQDLPDAVAGQADKLPEALRARVTFRAHDFFRPQPVAGGDVYILRAVLHNWSDADCRAILRQLRPALGRGARVVIQDGIMPGYGTSSRLGLLAERNIRAFDLTMMTLFNTREREEADWRKLVLEADPAFKVVQVVRPSAGTMGLIILEWLQEAAGHA